MNEFLKDLKWFFDFSDFKLKEILQGVFTAICFVVWVFGLFVIFS